MIKISGWVNDVGCAYRHFVGTDGNHAGNRVAMIEKTPRVRIREYHLGTEVVSYDSGDQESIRRWPEHLDWCSGVKGDGPDDAESRAWCDGMLKALGYQL